MKSLPTLFYESPAERGGRSSSFGLPADLLDRARSRVRIVAFFTLFGSGFDVVISVGRAIATHSGIVTAETPSPIPFLGTCATFTLSVAMVLLSRVGRIRSVQILRAALVFEILLCATLSITNPIAFYDDTGALPILTWVTPLLILFALIVPFPPRITLLTAILAAATRPLGLLLLDWLGRVDVSGEAYFTSSFGPTLGIVMAFFGSRVVHGLGLQVAEARRMGSYHLERLLGSGGMGEVWLARHRFLVRPAAVKLIRPEILGRGGVPASSLVDRFEREAQATASMRSPHTIGLYDYGITDSNVLYYVMELLDGYDVETLVERFGPLPAERAVHLLIQVCHSLAEAHEAGLIHRDIKPANLYVCRYGRDVDFVKVLDFGLVRMPAVAGESQLQLTSEQMVPGTPAYLSPEQASGLSPGDARSDLYALGCVAYWMLTGKLVFESAHPLQLLARHIQEEPVPPSARCETPIPSALDALVRRCLAKNPEQRPQTAVELREALEACPCETPWSEARAHAWWQRHAPAPTIEASPQSTAPA
ncbi:MAG: serine/threonine protein kinase [Candidatus Eisenbacteria bacterium]|uniref:Serine/threonine protein kinase n=1 Tax=Eiseniibacteriota bacterium TaxID=2212470 RepID=A0A956LZA7_UNCEI|nr:serine/threonine protein kinase [Candidatus Eisenbacteria bacterium]